MAQPIPIQPYYGNEYDPLAEPVFTKPDKPEESPILAARITKPNTAEPSNKLVTVRVSDRWRVVNPADGKAHTKGDTLTVPEHVAQEWLQSGWVELVTTKEKP